MTARQSVRPRQSARSRLPPLKQASHARPSQGKCEHSPDTLDQPNALGLHGLAKGFKHLEHKPEARGLDRAESLGLRLEYEMTLRRQKQFEARARAA